MWPPFALESLRAQVRQIEGRHRRATPSLPFGVGAVDSRLPGGALRLGALHEIAGGGNGAIDVAAAARSNDLADGPDLYQTFKTKKDGCVKVVFHPA